MLEKLRVRRDEVKNKVNKGEKKQKEPRDWSVGKHKGSTDSFYENGEAKLKARDRISEELYIENQLQNSDRRN